MTTHCTCTLNDDNKHIKHLDLHRSCIPPFRPLLTVFPFLFVTPLYSSPSPSITPPALFYPFFHSSFIPSFYSDHFPIIPLSLSLLLSLPLLLALLFSHLLPFLSINPTALPFISSLPPCLDYSLYPSYYHFNPFWINTSFLLPSPLLHLLTPIIFVFFHIPHPSLLLVFFLHPMPLLSHHHSFCTPIPTSVPMSTLTPSTTPFISQSKSVIPSMHPPLSSPLPSTSPFFTSIPPTPLFFSLPSPSFSSSSSISQKTNCCLSKMHHLASETHRYA